MGTLRSPETEAKYDALKATGALTTTCPLCDERETIEEFKYWRIVENLFPYDAIARVHHMILPKRHASDDELSSEEKEEFDSIKESYIQQTYEFLIEPMRHRRSIPAHSHLHLIVAKEEANQ